MNHKKFFIIDFDSTLIQTETLEELAQVALSDNLHKEEILSRIKEITDQGMRGELAFDESLRQRLELLSLTREHVETVKERLVKKITPSFLRNKPFFKQYKQQIYIISGGFTDLIMPIVEKFAIPPDHILANAFVFDRKGKVTGVDAERPLAHPGGKARAVKELGLQGEIFILGDGYTDFEIKQALPEAKFIAFTENVFRETVTQKADYVVPNLDEFLYIYDLPRSVSYPKSRMLALLLENIHQKGITALEKEGYAVEYFERALSRDELAQKIPEVSLLGIRSRTRLTSDLLQRADKLLTVGAFCIGTDQVDLPTCRQKGIAVFNAPFSNTRSVVELVLGEIIMLARGIFPKSQNLHHGVWDKSAVGAVEIRGKTLGIVGYGNIGSQISVLAEALGMKVIFYDVAEKLSLGNARSCQSLKELLHEADIVTLHVDGRVENKNLIGEKEFQQMKNGVLFLNLSRGSMVDITALVQALAMGKVKGAAIDVFPKEPESRDEVFISELQGLPHVILTPHIGGSTKEAQEHIGGFVAQKLIEYINTGSTTLNKTLPEIHAAPLKKAHRLLHIHKNVPGMLSQINHILAEHSLNIEEQYLKTTEEIGYVITDVNKSYQSDVLEKLKKIHGTIQFRVVY